MPCLSNGVAQGVTIKKDVVYATHDGVQLLGDLYLPEPPGRKAVYVNALFTIGIEGMSTEESRALLAFLCELPRVPEYQFRIRWQPGTLVFWDNRSTQHYACNDYYPNRRRMERVAVAGDRPY
ncbi:MAG: TauD/TfdA family dioxygenase [Betaproteobacteria bacterium]